MLNKKKYKLVWYANYIVVLYSDYFTINLITFDLL